MRHLSRVCLLGLLCSAACVSSSPERPEPTTATASTVRFFGTPPVLDQSARIGTQNAAQSFTPGPHPKALKTTLRTKWKARVGKTTARSMILAAGKRVVIGTEEGAWFFDARSGEQQAHVRSTDGAPLRGVAVTADGAVMVSAKGLVTRLAANGAEVWRAHADGTVSAAPALADMNVDGIADVVVGTGAGTVVALDGVTGRALWRTGFGGQRRVPVEVGASVGDLDHDGIADVVVGNVEGLVGAMRGRDGSPLWTAKLSAPLSSTPFLADMDEHGGLEALVTTADGGVAIIDGATGQVLWGTRVESDDGKAEILTAAPAVLPGPRIGALIVPTASNRSSDGLVVLAENERRFRSLEGAITSTPTIAKLDPDSTPDAIVGTRSGDVVAIDATGGRTFLANVSGAVLAAPLAADVDADGVRELIVVTSDGVVTCHATGAGDSAPPSANLGWTFARGRDSARALETRTPKEK